MLGRYDLYRNIALRVHEAIRRRVKRRIILDAAERLGLLDDGAVVADGVEGDILHDFLLLGYRQGRRTLAQRTLTKAWPREGTDERILLAAMADARYSVYAVERPEAGVGVHVRDVIAGERFFLVDRSFSRAAGEDVLLSGRVLRLPELRMTTGAVLPLPRVMEGAVVELADQYRTVPGAGRLERDDELDFAEELTASCLAGGMAERIEFANR